MKPRQQGHELQVEANVGRIRSLSVDYFLAFLALTFVLGVAISVGSLVIEEAELRRYPEASDLIVLTFAAVLENFGYRQLNTLWRLRGFWQWLNRKQAWGQMTRRGFEGGAVAP